MVLDLLLRQDSHVHEQALQMAEKLEWKADEASALQKVLTKLVNDKDAKVRLQLACTLGELKFDWAGDLLAEVLNSAEPGSPLPGSSRAQRGASSFSG